MSQHINPTPKQTDVALLESHLAYGDPIADCNSQTVRMARTDSNTLNTPYKQGLTQATEGLCIQAGQLTSAYKQQVYMEIGGTRLFVRQEARVNGVGTWGAWEQLALNSNFVAYTITSVDTLENLKSGISEIAATLPTNGKRFITFNPSFTGECFKNGIRCYGELYRRTDAIYSFDGVDLDGISVAFSNVNGTWHFSKFTPSQTFALSSSGTSFSVSNGSRIIVDFLAQGADACGTATIYVTNSGSVAFNKVAGITGLTVQSGTNTMTITGITGTMFARVYVGSISENN